MPPFLEASGNGVHKATIGRPEIPSAEAIFGSQTLAGINVPAEVSASKLAAPKVVTGEKGTYTNGLRRRPDTPRVPSIDINDKSLLDSVAAVDVTGQDASLLGLDRLAEKNAVPNALKAIVRGVVPREVGSVVLQAARSYSTTPVNELLSKAEEADSKLAGLPEAATIFEKADSTADRVSNLLAEADLDPMRKEATDAARVITAQAAVAAVVAERMQFKSRDKGGLTPSDTINLHRAHELTGVITGLMIEQASLEGLSDETIIAPTDQTPKPTPTAGIDYSVGSEVLGSEGLARRTKVLFGIPDARFKVSASLPKS